MRWGFFLLWMLVTSVASAAELRDLRVWDGPESTRIVFDLDGPANHTLFTLSNPERVVVDIDGLNQRAMAKVEAVVGQGVVARLRSGPRKNGVRVVLDVKDRVFANSFALPPGDAAGHRLVVDLAHPGASLSAAAELAPTQVPASAPAVAPPPVATPVPVTPAAVPQVPLRAKPIIVAIDAGHGGKDPGARGSTGLLEKDVALAVSRKLAKMINDTPNMRAVMTRDGDYFLDLRRRVDIARKHQADLFVSVHCNAFTRRDMRGSAVYVLSNRGATSEHARWLAQKENSADLVGGVDLHKRDNDLAAVLIDLSQGATMEASFDVGSRILGKLGQVNKLQRKDIQQAGFVVLKAPDIPSVLVETAFITNAHEEKLLGTTKFQMTLARQIHSGIKSYFETYRPQQQVVEAEAGAQYVSHNDADSGLREKTFTQGVSR